MDVKAQDLKSTILKSIQIQQNLKSKLIRTQNLEYGNLALLQTM